MSSFPSDRPAYLLPCLVIAGALPFLAACVAILFWLNLSSNAAGSGSAPLPQATQPALKTAAQTEPPLTTPTHATESPLATSTATARAGTPAAATPAALTAAAGHLTWPLVLSDTFDSNNNRWRVSSSDTDLASTQWAITRSVYVLDLAAKSGVVVNSAAAQPASASDLSLSVDVRHAAGSALAGYGVSVRAEAGNYYFVRIDDAQKVMVSLLYQHEWKQLLQATSDAIRPGAANRLTVEAVGSQLTVFVNGRYVGTVSDGTLHSGAVGMAVELGSGLTTRIEFDNLNLRVSPGEAAAASQTAAAGVARGTSTAQAAQATLTAHADWPLVISDTFVSNTHGWPLGKLDDSYGSLSRQLGDGKLRWEAHAASDVLWRYWPVMDTYDDFTVAVNAQVLTGTSHARYGFVLRENAGTGYVFEVTDDQRYMFAARKPGGWTTLIDWSQSSAIHPSQINRLVVDAAGSHFMFWINGEFVAQSDDTSFPRGKAGLALSLSANEDATLEFGSFEMHALNIGTPTATPRPPTATSLPAAATAQAATSTAAAAPAFAASTAQAAQATATIQARRAQVEHGDWPLVFSDTFADNAHAWPLDDAAAGFGRMQATLGGGAYRFQALATKDAAWTELSSQIPQTTDFALSVETRLPNYGSSARAGLAFRKAGASYYAFELRGDGTFQLARYRDGKAEVLIQPAASGSLQRSELHRLTVVAEGTTITLYIDDDWVAQTTDDKPTAGVVGLSMSLSAGDEALFEFSDFELRAPG